MIEAEEISKNSTYLECMEKLSKKYNFNIQEYIDSVKEKAVEIANELKFNKEIIEIAVLLSFLGLATNSDDYIKASGILGVKILSDMEQDEDTIAKVLMAIAGQGNNGNSINLFSAIILLASFIDFKVYLKIHQFPEEIINNIVLELFSISYSNMEISYKFKSDINNEKIRRIVDKQKRIIEDSAKLLNFKIIEINK